MAKKVLNFRTPKKGTKSPMRRSHTVLAVADTSSLATNTNRDKWNENTANNTLEENTVKKRRGRPPKNPQSLKKTTSVKKTPNPKKDQSENTKTKKKITSNEKMASENNEKDLNNVLFTDSALLTSSDHNGAPDQQNCNLCINNKYIANKLIKSLQKENQVLRESHGDIKETLSFYKDLLGIDITDKVENARSNSSKSTTPTKIWKIERMGSNGLIKMIFELRDASTEKFEVQLVESINCNVPEFMYDGIEFEKRSFMLFFYKIMQVICDSRKE